MVSSATSVSITSHEGGTTQVEQYHHHHRSSIFMESRKSFHFPPSVLAFFQEEYPSVMKDSRPLLDLEFSHMKRNIRINNSSNNNNNDNDNVRHASLEEEVRQSDDVTTTTTTTTTTAKPHQPTDTEHETRDDVDEVVITEVSNNNNIRSNGSSLQSCLDMLSSQDLDLNRVALQRLFLLTKGRAVVSSGNQHETMASIALIYGGQEEEEEEVWGSLEDRLRYAFCTMICDAPHDDVGMTRSSNTFTFIDQHDDENLCRTLVALMDGKNVHEDDDDDESDGSIYSTYSMISEFDHDTPQGKSWGVLHLQGLKVLVNALTQISHSIFLDSSDDTSDETIETTTLRQRNIPLHDTVWRNIIHSLVHNIETNHTADITGYSLKILRLLHVIHPDMVQPLLQHTLFPHLVYLQEYGQSHLFPMIHAEATYLLRRANYLW
jgi:hypothetical protein